MERDPVRQKLKDLLWKRGLTMAAASLALGRNRAYLHQYLERGLPKVLNYPDSVTLGDCSIATRPSCATRRCRNASRRRGRGASPRPAFPEPLYPRSPRWKSTPPPVREL